MAKNPFAFALPIKVWNLQDMFDSYMVVRGKFCKNKKLYQKQFDQALEDLVNKLITSQDAESALRFRCLEQIIADSEELSLGLFEALALNVEGASNSERILISSYFIHTLKGSNTEFITSALAVMKYLIAHDEERRAVHVRALLDCLNSKNKNIQRDAAWALYEPRIRIILSDTAKREIITVAQRLKRNSPSTYPMDTLLHYFAQIDESLRVEINQVFKSWKHEPYEARTVELPKQIENVLGPRLSSSLKEVIPHFHGLHEFADSLLDASNLDQITTCLIEYLTDLVERYVADHPRSATSRRSRRAATPNEGSNEITETDIINLLSSGPILKRVMEQNVVASLAEISENLPEIVVHCYCKLSASKGVQVLSEAVRRFTSLEKKLRHYDLELHEVLKHYLEELKNEIQALNSDPE